MITRFFLTLALIAALILVTEPIIVAVYNNLVYLTPLKNIPFPIRTWYLFIEYKFNVSLLENNSSKNFFRLFSDRLIWPAYVLIYLLNVLTIMCTVIVIVAIDSFFVGLFLQISACLKDLADVILDLESQSDLYDSCLMHLLI